MRLPKPGNLGSWSYDEDMTTQTLSQNIDAAVSLNEQRMAARQVVIDALEDGVPRDAIYELLCDKLDEYRERGMERQEELLLDLMDLFEGAARPDLLV